MRRRREAARQMTGKVRAGAPTIGPLRLSSRPMKAARSSFTVAFLLSPALACGSARAPSSAAAASAPPGDRELRFSVVSMGHVAGGSVVTIHPGGSRDATFAFNDRGRGPDEKTHYEVAPDGTFTRVDVTGKSYLKRPVDEHF